MERMTERRYRLYRTDELPESMIMYAESFDCKPFENCLIVNVAEERGRYVLTLYHPDFRLLKDDDVIPQAFPKGYPIGQCPRTRMNDDGGIFMPSEELLKKMGHTDRALFGRSQNGASWFDHLCRECGYNVVITQSRNKDYYWYCSNKYCKNHEGIETYDDEWPEWVTED